MTKFTHDDGVADDPGGVVPGVGPQLRHVHPRHQRTEGVGMNLSFSFQFSVFLPVHILRVFSNVIGLELQKLGDVVKNRKYNDKRDVSPALTDTPEISVERFANVEISLSGDQYNTVHAPSQSDLKIFIPKDQQKNYKRPGGNESSYFPG